MRQAPWLWITLVVACSKGEDKAPAGQAPPAAAEKSVKGTLTLGGALNAAVSWKPDLNLTCACIQDSKEWSFDVTMSDGAETFTALSVHSAKGVTLTSGKLSSPDPLRTAGNAGVTGGCTSDNRNVDGVIAVDLDAVVSGPPGEVTVKGHLDVVCRSGL